MQYKIHYLFSILLTLSVLCSPNPKEISAFQNTSALLTVGSSIARFEGTPLKTNQWLAEIGQLDTITGEHTVLLPLWGANAPANAAQINGLSWSHNTQQLAITLTDSSGKAGLILFDARTQSYQTILAFGHNYTEISRPSWSRDDGAIAFSARQPDNEQKIMLVNLTQVFVQVWLDGYAPTFAPSGDYLAYIAGGGELTILGLFDGTKRTFVLPSTEIAHLEWMLDGQRIIFILDSQVIWYDINNQAQQIIYDGNTQGEGTVLLLGLALSPDGHQVALTQFVQNADGNGLSQIITVDLDSGTSQLQVEHRFEETLLDDPRLFSQIDYQPPGAFLPGASSEGDF